MRKVVWVHGSSRSMHSCYWRWHLVGGQAQSVDRPCAGCHSAADLVPTAVLEANLSSLVRCADTHASAERHTRSVGPRAVARRGVRVVTRGWLCICW